MAGADYLTEQYNKFINEAQSLPTKFQIFQRGFTLAATSMRNRAIKVAQSKTDQNETINGIGQLPDIPE